jgi:glutathione S-transferase
VRLFRAPWSTNVERVTLALAHKGLHAEDVWIEYADRSPVERVSGQGLVPVLEDDGVVVADSQRILRHLEARRPSPPLFAADPLLEVFLEWFDGVWKGPPNAIEAAEAAGSPPDPAHGERLRAWLERFECILAGRDYLFGEFSAADCVAYPFLKYAAGRDPADDEHFHVVLARELAPGRELAGLAAWIERVGARPGAYARESSNLLE